MRNTVGTPVRGSDFFERNVIIDSIWEELETANVLLATPRR